MKISKLFQDIIAKRKVNKSGKEINFSERETINIRFQDRLIKMMIYSGKETISSEIRQKKNFFESGFLEFVQKNYPGQSGIIDIGSNIGNHSLFFTEFLKYDKIICFEPYYSNIELLKVNLLGKKAEIIEVALSDREGELALYNSEKANSGGFSLVSYENISYKVLPSVKVKTLDSYNFDNISMIKIDVEANELNVLKGGRNTIIRNRPIIFVEELFHGYPQLFEANRFNAFFDEIGYVKKESNIANSFMDLWIPEIR